MATLQHTWIPLNQDQLHNLWGPVQNENMGPRVQNYYQTFQDGNSRTCNQGRGLSKGKTLCDYTGCSPMKPACFQFPEPATLVLVLALHAA